MQLTWEGKNNMNKLELAKVIDHTNLKPELNRKGIIALLNEAKEYNFIAVCIPASWVYFAKQRLAGTGIQVATVPNWESGGGLLRLKGESAFEEADAIDYILDIHRFVVGKDWPKTAMELEQIRLKTRGELKIIIETTVIRAVAEEKKESYELLLKKACKLVQESGANWIKTDSGLFMRDPKTGMQDLLNDVKLMRQFCTLPVKAAGGIKTKEEVEKLVELGATRIGTSRGVSIIQSAKE